MNPSASVRRAGRARPTAAGRSNSPSKWGDTPPALKKELKRSALATGKGLIEDRIQSLEAGLAELRRDVQALFESMEED